METVKNIELRCETVVADDGTTHYVVWGKDIRGFSGGGKSFTEAIETACKYACKFAHMLGKDDMMIEG